MANQQERALIEDLTQLPQQGTLPFIGIVGDYVPEVWHKLCLACWFLGSRERTPKHQEGFPLGFDACMGYTIRKPLNEPRLHSFGCCDAPEGLLVYRDEVCFGVHDGWVKDITIRTEEDEKEAYWDYSYHQRLEREVQVVLPATTYFESQDKLMIEKMQKDWMSKHRFGRDYMLHTWIPQIDNFSEDAPCLQMIQFRLLQDPNCEEETYNLVWVIIFRSHDLFNGWPMNMYALSEYQRLWAIRLTNALGIQIVPGEMNGLSTSLHLYGAYFETLDLAGYLKRMRDNPWTDFACSTEKYLPREDWPAIHRRLAAQLDFEAKTGIKRAIDRDLVEVGYDLDTFPYPPEWDD